MNAHTPNNGYFSPITSRLPGECFETFYARDWAERTKLERRNLDQSSAWRKGPASDGSDIAKARSKARRQNILDMIGAGELTTAEIHARLVEQGSEANLKNTQCYMSGMREAGLVDNRLTRVGFLRVSIWRVVK